MKEGEEVKLSDGSTVKWDGYNLEINTKEYNINIQDRKGYLDTSFKVNDNGVFSDGVMPGGLLGQTADGNDDRRETTGLEGKGVIKGTPKDYEVPGLFSNNSGESPIQTKPVTKPKPPKPKPVTKPFVKV